LGEFQRLFINSFPSWVCILLVVIIFTGFSMIFFWLIEKYTPHWANAGNELLLSTAARITSAIYALLLGSVVVVLWQAFGHAVAVTEKEATSLSLMTYQSMRLSEPTRGEMLQEIGKYIQVVTKEEWPALREGKAQKKGDFVLKDIFDQIEKCTPQNDFQRYMRDNIVKNLHKLLEYRKERMDSVSSALSDPLRILLLIGFFIISFFMSVLSKSNQKVHHLSVLLVGSIIAFNLAIAINLDYPFSESLSVTSDPYTQGILARFK